MCLPTEPEEAAVHFYASDLFRRCSYSNVTTGIPQGEIIRNLQAITADFNRFTYLCIVIVLQITFDCDSLLLKIISFSGKQITSDYETLICGRPERSLAFFLCAIGSRGVHMQRLVCYRTGIIHHIFLLFSDYYFVLESTVRRTGFAYGTEISGP